MRVKFANGNAQESGQLVREEGQELKNTEDTEECSEKKQPQFAARTSQLEVCGSQAAIRFAES